MNILIALVIGMAIGYIWPLKEKYLKVNGKLQQIGVIALLFFMGASIGSNDEIVKNIGSIGLIAFIFSMMTVLGSVILVYMLSQRFIVSKNKYMKNSKDKSISSRNI